MSERTRLPKHRGRGGQDGGGRGTLSLGHVAGIRIGVNWSVLVIFGLIAYGLAAWRFPQAYSGHSTAAYVTAGLLTAVVFFASLLAHELSHALVARRNGQEVEGITLWLLGGVARLHGEAQDPAAELRVAGVGPLVSLILGGFFLGVTALAALLGGGGLVGGAILWLGLINVALAVFNSIPAAPLDGGRLLRAFLWWRTGNATKSAVWASQTGKVFGWLLVAVGLFSLFTGAVGGLWLAVIGWFLITAASAEGQQAAVRERLSGIPIRRVMTPEPMTVPAAMTVRQFMDDYLLRHRHTAFPVTDYDGTPAGLVTLDRIRAVQPTGQEDTRIGDIFVPLSEVARASPDDSVADLLPRLGERPEGRALIFTGERLVGIVSPRDVSRTLAGMSVSGQRGAFG